MSEQQRMYKGRQLDNQKPAARLRLMRTADGVPVDIANALDAERERLAAARDRKRGHSAAIAIGCFIAMLFIGIVAWGVSVVAVQR